MSSTLNALCRSIIAGATAVTFCNPIWVVKTRIQLQTNVEPELISFNINHKNIHSVLHVMHLASSAFEIITALAMRFFAFTAKKDFAASSKDSPFPIWASLKLPFNLPGISGIPKLWVVTTVSNASSINITIILPNSALFLGIPLIVAFLHRRFGKISGNHHNLSARSGAHENEGTDGGNGVLDADFVVQSAVSRVWNAWNVCGIHSACAANGSERSDYVCNRGSAA